MANELIPADAEHPYVLHALIRKRAELAGLVEQHRLEVRQLLDDLEHVDATIRLFHTGVDIAAIRAKTAPVPLRARSGEVTRGVFAALREAEAPMSAPEIATRLVAERGLSTDDDNLMALMVSRLRPCLRDQRKAGFIQNAPHPSGLLGWELVRRLADGVA